MFWCFPVFCWRFLVKKIHCKKKRWLRFIRRPWFGFSATETRKHVSISPTVESMLKLLDSFLDGAPETKSMVQLFSPCRFGNQNLSAEQSKMKVWQFQTCRPKKGECRRIQIRDMKKILWTLLDYILLVNGAMITKPNAMLALQLPGSLAEFLRTGSRWNPIPKQLGSSTVLGSGVPAMWKGSQQPARASSIEVWTWLPSSQASKKQRRWRRQSLGRVCKPI